MSVKGDSRASVSYASVARRARVSKRTARRVLLTAERLRIVTVERRRISPQLHAENVYQFILATSAKCPASRGGGGVVRHDGGGVVPTPSVRSSVRTPEMVDSQADRKGFGMRVLHG